MSFFLKKQKTADNVAHPDNMTFVEHLEELRWHIIRSLIAIGTVMIGVFIAKDFVFDTIILGPKHNDFFTYRFFCSLSNWLGMGKSLCIEAGNFEIVNLDMSGQFLTHVQVSITLGFIAACPYVFWETWRFIKPGLQDHEIKYSKGIVAATSILFLSGVLFGYYVMAPFSINFLVGYTLSDKVQNTISLSSYIDNLSTIVLGSGISFELPVAVFFLTKIGLIGSGLMRTYRKHALVIILFIAAIITPPDVMSQLLVTIPLYTLYELSILIAQKIEKKQAEAEAAEHALYKENEQP